MLNRTTILATLAAALLAFALMPTATAQVAEPYAKVSLEMDSGGDEVAAGQEIQVPVTVYFEASNFTCEQEAQFVVALTVSGAEEAPASGSAGGNTSAGTAGNDTGMGGGDASASGGLSASVEPTELNFTVSGTHHNINGGAPGYNQSGDASLTIVVGPDTPAGANSIDLTAAFDGGTPEGCQAMGDLPDSSATANYTVMFAGSDEADNGTFGDNDTGFGEPAGNDTAAQGDSPGPGGLLVGAALATAFVAADLRRRRKDY